MKLPISQIKIGSRQRLDLGDLSQLADSLSRLGQIHNIGINENNLLIWGRRRLEAAKLLGWTEIEAVQRTGLTEIDEQELELEEDIKRKDRTWQEESIAMSKLFALKSRQARAKGQPFGVREMGDYIGYSKDIVSQYVFNVSVALLSEPRDEALWNAKNFHEALDMLRKRQEKEASSGLQKLHEQAEKAIAKLAPVVKKPDGSPASPVEKLDKIMPEKIGMTLTLRERAMRYNQQFSHLGPPNTELYYSNKNNREFLTGFWFVGGGNISDLYGSYQQEYLKRVETLFQDAVKVVHLFVGSLPPSEKYIRVGLPQGENRPDIECDAHYLSSKLPFKCDLIYADPPYSIEDSEHYDNSMVNRERVLEEAALVLNDNGYIVWLDQALPIFKNELLEFVGAIGYVRSTGNRFRIISLFRKAKCKPTPSSPPTNATSSPSKTT